MNFEIGMMTAPVESGLEESGSGEVDEYTVDLAKVILSIFICVVGLIGNFIAIFVIIILKEYQKSVTHWYVLQLAIADSLFLLTLPFKVSEDINNEWIFPEWFCKAEESILFLNYYASILFLVVMSFDRYIAVCHSFSTVLQKLRKRYSAFIITFFVWIGSLLLCVPVMLYSFKRGIDPTCKCTYVFPKPKVNVPDCNIAGLPENLKVELCEFVEESFNTHCKVPDNSYFSELFRLHYLASQQRLNQSVSDIFVGSGGIDPSEFVQSQNAITPGSGKPSPPGSPSLTEARPALETSYSEPMCNYWQDADGFKIFLLCNFVVMFVLPLVIMIACYGLIVRRLDKTKVQTSTPVASFSQTANRNSETKSSHKKKRKTTDADRRRVTITCVALVISFIACWLPFHSIHLAKIVGIKNTETQTCVTLQTVGTLFAYLNSALNPYLYSFLGTSFARRWLSAILTFRQSVSRQRTSSSGSGSVRAIPNRSMVDRNPTSYKTKTTKLIGHRGDTKNSLSDAINCVETTRPFTSFHSQEPRSMSSQSFENEFLHV